MRYCPFYSKDCPEDSSCAAWKSYGCSATYKPGIPATYLGGAEPVDVFIIHIERSVPPPLKKFDIIYANADTGEIAVDDDLSKFAIRLF